MTLNFVRQSGLQDSVSLDACQSSIHIKSITASIISSSSIPLEYLYDINSKLQISLAPIGDVLEFSLIFDFSSTIAQNAGCGLYKVDFNSDHSNTHGLYTHFEPCHTRMVFPCIDKPKGKAIFKLTMTAPEDFKVISNTDPISITSCIFEVPMKCWTFSETPMPIPPYLFGFWLAPFTNSLSTTVHLSGTDVRISAWHAGPQERDARLVPNFQFALDAAAYTVQFFHQMFGVYTSSSSSELLLPMTKLDLIALPSLACLGMENLFAITFIDTYFAVNMAPGGRTEWSKRRRIARLVAHEIAHQWYGNLVTTKTYNELWLKEGMVRFLEFVCTNAEFPSSSLYSHFISDVFSKAMTSEYDDGFLKSSHPVVIAELTDESSSEDIHNLFDVITYGKGACVLRNLWSHVWDCSHTTDISKLHLSFDFLRKYLNSYRFVNASMDNLWQCVDDTQIDCLKRLFGADGADCVDSCVSAERIVLMARLHGLRLKLSSDVIPCKSLISPWIFQSHFPVLFVDSISESVDGLEILVSQQFVTESHVPVDKTKTTSTIDLRSICKLLVHGSSSSDWLSQPIGQPIDLMMMNMTTDDDDNQCPFHPYWGYVVHNNNDVASSSQLWPMLMKIRVLLTVNHSSQSNQICIQIPILMSSDCVKLILPSTSSESQIAVSGLYLNGDHACYAKTVWNDGIVKSLANSFFHTTCERIAMMKFNDGKALVDSELAGFFFDIVSDCSNFSEATNFDDLTQILHSSFSFHSCGQSSAAFYSQPLAWGIIYLLEKNLDSPYRLSQISLQLRQLLQDDGSMEKSVGVEDYEISLILQVFGWLWQRQEWQVEIADESPLDKDGWKAEVAGTANKQLNKFLRFN